MENSSQENFLQRLEKIKDKLDWKTHALDSNRIVIRGYEKNCDSIFCKPYCPITALCQIEKGSYHLNCYWGNACKELGIDINEGYKIVNAADENYYSDQRDMHQLRQKMLNVLGLN